MALKALMLRKKVDSKKKELEALRAKDEEFVTREAELEASIAEAETEEEQRSVEEEVEAFNGEKDAHKAAKETLENEVRELEEELAEEERQQENHPAKPEERGTNMDERTMERRAFADFVRGIQERSDYNMEKGNNGYVIPTSIANEIVKKVEEICPIFRMAKRYNVKGILEVPTYPASTSHVIAAAYASEFSDLEASSGDFGHVQLTGFLAGALAKISKSLVNNADVDIVPFVIDEMAAAFASFYEKECLVGTASKALGIGRSSNLVTNTGTYKSSVTLEDLIDLQGAIPDVFQNNACWIMSPTTRNDIRAMVDTNNRPLLQPDVANGFGITLLGRPVYVSGNMPEMGTADNLAIYYGDFSGLGVKMVEDLEIQVLNEHYAAQHAIGVVGWTEFDAKIVNPQKIVALKMGSSDPS